jgi:hypothetical protein
MFGTEWNEYQGNDGRGQQDGDPYEKSVTDV